MMGRVGPRASLNALATVGLVASVAHLGRLPRVAWDTMYAEDGFTFVQGAVDGTAWWGTPYAGYLHVLPRIVASVVTGALPVRAWAWGMAVGAALVVGLVAALAYAVTRHLGGGRLLGVVAAAAPVLVPVAGIESIANTGNTHSYLAYGALFGIAARPRRRWVRVVLALVVFLFAATEIQAIVIVPAALVLLTWHTRCRWPTVGALLLGLAAQAAAFLSTGRSRDSAVPPAVAVARGYLFDGVLGSLVGRVGIARTVVTVGTWWLLAAVFVGWIILLVLALRAHPRRLVLALLIVAASIGTWAMAHIYSNFAAVDFVDGPFKLVRWGTAPALLLLATVPLVAAPLIERGGVEARATRVLLVGLLVVQTASFVLPTSRSGTYWGAEIAKATPVCRTGAAYVDVTIVPTDAAVRLPCRYLR